MRRSQKILLTNPLTEDTRKERRMLLGLSVLAFAVGRTSLFPTEIAALGMKLESRDRASVVLIFAVVMVYFVVTFIVYAAVDFVAWYVSYDAQTNSEDLEQAQHQYEAEQRGAKNVVIGIAPVPKWDFLRRWTHRYARFVVAVRVVWDVGLPAAIGVVVTISLLGFR